MCAQRFTAIAALLIACASPPLVSASQSAGGNNASDVAIRQAIVEAEVTRASSPEALKPLIDGAQSSSPAIQQLAVRALGRLERAALVPNIQSALDAASPTVRAEAANALAQAVQGPANQSGVAGVTTALRDRLAKETDPTVRAVLYQSLGRINHNTPEDVRKIELLLTEASKEAGKDPALVTLQGIAKGFEAVTRTQVKKGPVAPEAVQRLRELARIQSGGTPAAPANAARVRQLALIALQWADASDVDTLLGGLKDSDVMVRKVAASFLDSRGNPRYSDAKVKELSPVIVEAVKQKDRSPSVRFEAVQAYGRHLRHTGCDPLIEAASDPHTHVAQAAIDGLGRGCPAAEKDKVTAALKRFAESLPPDAKPSPTTNRVDWHRAARAIVALASTAPESAKASLPTFIRHPVWQVRMYTARAAAAMNDADTLRTLADDQADNVRAAAITGLARVTQHADDRIFIAALNRPDHSVIQSASRALQGSSNKTEAVPALLATLKRLTEMKRDNTRDPRVAILQRLQELASAEQVQELKSMLSDFDPRVATVAAETLSKATGNPHKASAVRPPTPVPNVAEVIKLEASAVRVTMRTGGAFELRLLPADAPATVERFVRLARANYYNGLTFHRVVPNWVIQGGSPGANEVTGDSPFMVDEVGLRTHTKGSLGISTRGHDTGDAQIFVNLGDNPSLDHTFGVWAEVTSGMDTVDAIVEGDVIDKIEVRARSTKSR
jgi:cyclophilin family peptidyl-prolyl cis-trans isomerase